MAVALQEAPPVGTSETLGPHRRAEYEALPENPRCELIYGRFFVSPSPSPLHQQIVLALSRFLEDIAEASDGLLFPAPMDVRLQDHCVVQPDLIYLSKETRHLVREKVEGAPDLVVEVLSPGTARRDRGDKLGLYAESGIREYWIVDPEERQIEFLVLRDGRYTVALPKGSSYSSDVLPEVTLDLKQLWDRVERRFKR